MMKADGAAEGTRTPDPNITNVVLYQLSYCGVPMVRLNDPAVSRKPCQNGTSSSSPEYQPVTNHLPFFWFAGFVNV